MRFTIKDYSITGADTSACVITAQVGLLDDANIELTTFSLSVVCDATQPTEQLIMPVFESLKDQLKALYEKWQGENNALKTSLEPNKQAFEDYINQQILGV